MKDSGQTGGLWEDIELTSANINCHLIQLSLYKGRYILTPKKWSTSVFLPSVLPFESLLYLLHSESDFFPNINSWAVNLRSRNNKMTNTHWHSLDYSLLFNLKISLLRCYMWTATKQKEITFFLSIFFPFPTTFSWYWPTDEFFIVYLNLTFNLCSRSVFMAFIPYYVSPLSYRQKCTMQYLSPVLSE